jgi:hypothetical protein
MWRLVFSLRSHKKIKRSSAYILRGMSGFGLCSSHWGFQVCLPPSNSYVVGPNLIGFTEILAQSMVGPALPTIVHDLGSKSFIWVGSAYALVATACIPLSGGFAQVFPSPPAFILHTH